VVVDRDHVAVDALLEHGRQAAGADVLADEVVARVHRDVADARGLGVVGHLQAALVVGVEHGAVAGDLDDDALELGELVEVVDAAEAEVVGGDVEDGADVAGAVAHAGAQEAAAGRLEDGEVDGRVAQDHLRGHRPGHVADDGALAVDVDAVGGAQADGRAGHLVDVGDHAGDGGLAVGAGDGGDGDAGRGARREQHVHDGAGDVARAALGRGDVHAEAGGGVDLADGAADLAVGAGDVGGDEVDAGDVEADRVGGAHGHLAVVGVDRRRSGRSRCRRC
jgi:hypothetical protein